MKKTVLKLAAKAAYATAKKAGNSASIYGMYQPKGSSAIIRFNPFSIIRYIV